MFGLLNKSFIILLLFTFNIYSDVMFEMEYKQIDSSQSDKTNAYIKNNLLKMDFLKGGSEPDASVIFRSDMEEMITLDHNEKSYFVMDKKIMNNFSDQMNSAMAQMEQAMKDMTPEEREMMKNMMKGKLPDIENKEEYVKPELKEIGTGNINGYSCVKYDVYRGNEKTRQYCVTKWANINGSDEIKDIMLKMSEFMEEFSKSFSSGSGIFASSIEFEKNIFLQMSKLNGFPVQTIDYDNGAVTAVSTFKSSKIISIDNKYFDPPTNYKKQNLHMQ